ncbi:SKN1-domain-containing protein [Tilletiopsis washingtonensis]|uniref:SKN1-domain-containing protein n=1 Tax=Tilletiopsis washingtonensis TaxID=58919 RepID=A0A316Z1Y1_9BASI|nr:SKN1-domain-containing protein [Tilletiopsis washingtonensis]PWN95541.1 SKN1-domain-containing protein [Tilletiopsis washingtonensis]
MLILVGAVLALFMGYPLVFHYFLSPQEGHRGGFGLGGTNSTGQVPTFESMGMRSDLIDPDTDPALYKIKGTTGQDLVLVFSDEFNLDGRSFYPGDDPFWTAVDLWAHGTGDYEWYDPAAVTTSDGALHITASEDAIHNLNFRSGQLTTWNQFCFTGGFFEVSVRLPGSPQVSGWWPAAWTMGNLGRANYGATTEGMWPYSYDTCDTGTLINQTNPDGLGPISALQSGGETVFNDKYDTTSVSWLPGQRLSACTCSGDDHPGPTRSDGSYVGRSAPEIDVFEAQVSNERGDVSLSGQFAPFNAGYWLNNASGTEWQGYDPTFRINSYRGNVLQQSASGVADTNQDAYELSGGTFSTYGFEYVPGLESDGAYITWYLDGKLAWRMNAAAVGADARAQISARTIPEEPMYLILNLALSSGFGYVDFDKLTFPATMSVDYVRIYQPPDKINVGCDPPNFPTADYIQKHLEAYTNSNLTTWGNTRDVGGFEQDWPRNRLYSGGCDVEPRKYPGRERASATAA